MTEISLNEGIAAWLIPLFFIGLSLFGAIVLWLVLGQQNRQLKHQLEQQQQTNENLQQRAQYAETQLQTQRATALHERRSADEKIRLLQASEERLTQQFENLANKIFDQKSQGLQQQHQQTLSATLEPFKQQLDAFKRQVEQQYTDETKERSALKQELTSLRDLNRQMAHEAEALTKALKGDTKQQGNWGEIVLQRILEQSGLREGHEYQTQSHHRDEQGRSFRPDVLVHLPNKKDVVIDAKVSLSAYERYFNSDDEQEKARLLHEHVQSVKQHIKGLGKKNYQHLEGIRTLDYVLMFVPVEPAFLLAVDREPELIRLALEHQIMLVSPTNLLVALRTVHNIWQYEHQNRNAETIALEAAKLYDKFVGFTDDLDKIGSSLQTLDNRYQEAVKKLSSGRGNLVSRIERFRQLGVQTSKRIADDWLEDPDEDSKLESPDHK